MKKSFFVFVILFACSLLLPNVNAQPIREKNKKGAPFLVLDNNVLRLKSEVGIELYYFDGQIIHVSHPTGDPLYCLDVNTLRSKNKMGESLLYFDGMNIREKDKDGAIIYYLDGNVLRRGDQKGEAAYYFEVIPEKWIIACLIFLDRL